MRPGVCTAPEPAPERDRPSEGCQLSVLYTALGKLISAPSYVNYVTKRRPEDSSRNAVTPFRDDLSRRPSETVLRDASRSQLTNPGLPAKFRRAIRTRDRCED